jgi:hypothetical protein
VLVRLDDAVVTAVKDLQQTVVAEIKAVTADGKISEAEKQRIKDAAVANVKSYLRCRRSPKGESHANPPLPPEDTMQRAAALSVDVSVRATVRNGRLVVDQPTDLPEGTVLDLVVDDEGDQLDEKEREALNAAISRSLSQSAEGRTAAADVILEKLRARHGG